MLRTLLRFLIASPIIAVVVIIVVINVRLLSRPSKTPRDSMTLKELHSLRDALAENADLKMQRLYPEGYVFLNAMYALAWYNLATSSVGDRYFTEAQLEIQRAWQRIDSPTGREPFTEELSLPYGAFYRGWNNYVLARKLSMEAPEDRSEKEVSIFKASCDTIASALAAHTYPVSYYGAAWPADVLMCVASLANHDIMYGPRYHDVIQDWVTRVKMRLDRRGLIPHAVQPLTGDPLGAARGSSQSLMLILLNEIDETFAREQFALYRMHFVDTVLGLPGVREFPKGERGFGDVDSGPVVMGLGAAATIVGADTLHAFGDLQGSAAISQLIDAAGMPIETSEERHYLFGTLPIADAFIAWTHASSLDTQRERYTFTRFHLFSFIAVSVLVAFAWILLKPPRADSSRALTIGW